MDERHVWLGRNGGLELRATADGALLRVMKHDPLNRDSLGGNEVRALMRDRAGWIWTGGYGGGLQRHNPANTSTWVRGRDPGQLPQLIDPSTRAMVQLDTGEIWLGSNESGVTVLDEQLRSIATLRPAPGQRGGLSGGRISSLVQMKDGSVWLGSDGGLHQYTRDRQLLRVIDDLLELSRLERGTFLSVAEPFSPRAVVARTVDLLSPEALHSGLLLEVDVDDAVPERVSADPSRMQQVLMNLLMNSIEALHGVDQRLREVCISVRRRNEAEVVATITDNGAGIAPCCAERLFEAFFSTKRSMGLGLAISQRIVESHGGRLWLQPQEPWGTIAAFSLPCGEGVAGR